MVGPGPDTTGEFDMTEPQARVDHVRSDASPGRSGLICRVQRTCTLIDPVQTPRRVVLDGRRRDETIGPGVRNARDSIFRFAVTGLKQDQGIQFDINDPWLSPNEFNTIGVEPDDEAEENVLPDFDWLSTEHPEIRHDSRESRFICDTNDVPLQHTPLAHIQAAKLCHTAELFELQIVRIICSDNDLRIARERFDRCSRDGHFDQRQGHERFG